MIKVTKDYNAIPPILINKRREEAFYNNVKAKKFVDGTNLYKHRQIKTTLNKIYHNKCAYCEKDISDEIEHIEHYRPTSIYYWLAFSWDNLLVACAKCNISKSDKFDVAGKRVEYQSEKFEDYHKLRDKYDEIEKPYMINPEKDDVIDIIKYNVDGTITSSDKRVSYTIEVCNLNRKELIQHRMKIINDFKNSLDDCVYLFLKTKNIEVFIPIIKRFININVKDEYFSFRRYIIQNIDKFIENKLIVKIIDKITAV